MYTGIEQLHKWMLNGGSQVSHCQSRNLQIRGDGKDDPCSNGLKLETQLEFIFSLI